MKKIMSTRWLFAMFIVISGLLLIGCSDDSKEVVEPADRDDGKETEQSAEGEAEGKTGTEQVVNLIAGDEIPTLRSNGQIDGLSSTIMSNIYEGLYRLGEDSTPAEGIAKSYNMNDTGDEYVFRLREDATWSDGTPVTAHDFVYAWQKAVHPDTISPHANLLADIQNSREIQDPDSDLYGAVEELGATATDDYTLEVKLDVPIPYFINLTTHPAYLPQHEDFVEEQGESYALEPEFILENGPFIMEEWKHDDSWVLVRNEEYWDNETVKLDKIITHVVKDNATAVNLYEVGDIDIVNLSSDFIDLFENDAEMNTSVEFEMYFLRLNQENEFLSNVNIRKAIDMGWNKEEAAEAILKNGSLPIYNVIPEGFAFSPDGVDFRDKYEGFNMEGVEKAKEYWEKGLGELDVDSIELEILSYDDEQRSTMAEYIRNQLQTNLEGLTVTIHQQPNKVKLDLEDKMDYDISHSGWRGSVQDPTYYLEIWDSEGPYNWQAFANDEYDKIVHKANTDLSDPNKRFEELQEAERILIEQEAGISPMYQTGTARLIKPHVKGYVAHPNTTFGYKWMYVEE